MAAEEMSFDVIVVGSGPGGYVCAIRAAQNGLKTALVEKDSHFGGTCLHVGCIPTKAMLHAARLHHEISGARRFGILAGEPTVDFAAVQKQKGLVVKKLSMGVQGLLKKNGVKTLRGVGVLKGPGVVSVGEREVRARNIVIATGSEARTFPGMEPDGKGILTNREILALEKIPASLVVIGAGAVGMEFASIFAQFGSRVTVVELLPRVLPLEDEDVSREMEKLFRKRKIDIRTGTKVAKLSPSGEGYEVVLDAGGETESIQTGNVLVAVGRKPNTVGIGLENTAIKTEKGFIPVDPQCHTVEEGIYAIGDVIATPQLAHTAAAEGLLVADLLGGREVQSIPYDRTPGVTYSHPMTASVGLTEAEARKRGHKVSTGKFPFLGIGKASVEGANDGFVKIVADDAFGEILGIHIVHASAGEMTGEAVAVLAGELGVEDLAHAVHAHPTLSEGIMEAAHAVYGRPVHM